MERSTSSRATGMVRESSTPPSAPPAVHPRLDTVFESLEDAGVGWCLVRGEDRLAAPSGDVDLLIAGEWLDAAARILGEFEFARVPAWGHGTHVFFVSYDEESDLWLKLDVVRELSYGPCQSLRTRAEDACLTRTMRLGPCRVFHPEDAFWAVFLHCLLDVERIPDGYRERLSRSARDASGDGPLAEALSPRLPEEWSLDRILDAVDAKNWSLLEALGPKLRRTWSRRRPLETSSRLAGQSVARLANRFRKAVVHRGPALALLGPDGSGKSSLAAALAQTFFFPARVVYAGVYPRLEQSQRRPPGLRFGFRLGRLWHARLAAEYHRSRGRLVIFDRFPYDLLLSEPRDSRVVRTRRWLLAHACSRPDLVVVLDAPAEVLAGRKEEHPVDHLEVQRRGYAGLLKRLPGAVAVDASRDADEVRRRVTRVLWTLYLRGLRGAESGPDRRPN